MENKVLISIIMPAYNVASFIDDAIKSVMNQTYINWELIIIDDGSTDNTAEKIQTWLKIDKRIQYYYQENGKQGKARNLGISKSKGKYLAFLDADDLWLPKKIEIQIEEIQKNKVDLVFSNSYIFNNTDIDDVSRCMKVKQEVFSGEKSLKLFLEGNRIPILTVLVKKEKVVEVGSFSEKENIQNVEDYHLWLKLLLSGNVFYSTDEIFAKYRVHINSVTSKEKCSANKIFNVFFDLLQSNPIHTELIKQGIKSKFKDFYKNNLFTKSELSDWIKKNIQYLSKSKVNYLYYAFNFLLPTKVTKRALIYILNA